MRGGKWTKTLGPAVDGAVYPLFDRYQLAVLRRTGRVVEILIGAEAPAARLVH